MFTPCMTTVMAGALAFLAVADTALGAAKPSEKDVQAVVEANNAFATDLYTELEAQRGNVFFSPVSISTALAMTEAGAAGNTQAQLLTGLRLDRMDGQRVAPAMGALGAMLSPRGDHPGYELSIANALWPQAGLTLNSNFTQVVQSSYGGVVAPVDFSKAQPAAKTINDWVAKFTNNRIKDLITPALLTADTRLVLTNAVYFKGDWVRAFAEQATREESFTTAGGVKVQVPMMHQTGRFYYGHAPSLQVLRLDYGAGDLSMTILLPERGSTLSALEKNLAKGGIEQWLAAPDPQEVEVSLPRFRMSYEVMLNTALQGLGMADAFDPKKADFSGIATQEPLYISAAIHKAYVDVNERGTEAAAATGAVMRPAAVAQPPARPIAFRADHPFVFVIQHAQSGAVLFMGRVENPKE